MSPREHADGDAVAPDGSPAAVYLAAPGEPEAAMIDAELPFAATVLDLGCGPGRLAHPLADRGHAVVGVDESPQMLSHLRPEVDAVPGRIETLDLGRRFDAVLAASHLVNVAGSQRRRALLAACARHVDGEGIVLVQRYPVAWLRGLDTETGAIGEVEVTMRVRQWVGERFDGEVTYRLGARSWTQRFHGEVVDDAALDAALAEVGLQRDGELDDGGSWVRARPLS